MNHDDDDDEEAKRDFLLKNNSMTPMGDVNHRNNVIVTDFEIDFQNGDEQDELESDIKRKLTRASQQILVPIFFSLLSALLAYILIGVFASYDVIRYFSFFLGNYFL